MPIDLKNSEALQESAVPVEAPSDDRKKTLMIAAGGVLLSLVVLIAVYAHQRTKGPQGSSASQAANPQANVESFGPSPTTTPQMAFMELTMPYLKSRSYDSSLGNLELVSTNESYTSYLTNYDSDGLRINGQLTIPRGSPPQGGFPAVIFLHGYIPPQQYRTLVNYVSYVDFLARRGLVVFKIDLRGHDQSEGEPGGSYYSGDYVIDVLNAHAALTKEEYINPENIGLWGHSMAGNVVFRSFVAKPEIRKVVIWAGAVYTYEDFSEYRIEDRSYQPPPQDSERRRKRDELFNLYGEFSTRSPFWVQVPATNYLDGVAGAVEVHHALDDPVVDIGYSRNLMGVLDGTGIEHQLFEYSSGGHNLTGPSFTQAMQRSADFLKE